MKSIEAFAEELSDAYSTDRYRNGWSGCIRMLRRHNLNDRQIEAIIRSKWTRWAGDASNHRYGQITSKDLEKMLPQIMPDLDELVRGTFANDEESE